MDIIRDQVQVVVAPIIARIKTAFRGPTLNQLGGVSTSLAFVSSTGAFKPIDSVGNPDLEPESAVALSAGLIAYLLDDDES